MNTGGKLVSHHRHCHSPLEPGEQAIVFHEDAEKISPQELGVRCAKLT
jgi:hypothetical protein